MFESAVEKTILKEGFFANEPNDRGGPTKYGWAKNFHPEIDFDNFTREDAIKKYYLEFWKPLRLDEVANEIIQDEIFDTAVNCGIGGAGRIAQKALNFLGEKLLVDGDVGPKTISAINRWCSKDAEALFRALNGFQFLHYVECVMKDPKCSFARGWMRRIQDYR